MEKSLKIAICLSGQPRTWERCIKRCKEVFSHQGEVDFFFHLWDYNTLPNLLASHNGGIKIRDEFLTSHEQQEIIKELNPKKYLFESRKKIEYWNTTIPLKQQFGWWCREQFYSIYRASLLKREYEIENNFTYDIAIRFRSDLFLVDDITLYQPAVNTLYTTHCGWSEQYNCYRVGDIFYYADSHTYDQVSEFFKFLSFVPTKWVTSVDNPPPEIALYFYLANIGIINLPIHKSMKILRDPRVAEVKGYLDNYEII